MVSFELKRFAGDILLNPLDWFIRTFWVVGFARIVNWELGTWYLPIK